MSNISIIQERPTKTRIVNEVEKSQGWCKTPYIYKNATVWKLYGNSKIIITLYGGSIFVGVMKMASFKLFCLIQDYCFVRRGYLWGFAGVMKVTSPKLFCCSFEPRARRFESLTNQLVGLRTIVINYNDVTMI